MGVQDINAAVAAVTAGLVAAGASIVGALRDGTYTDRQVQHLRATLSGLAADIDEIRGTLDAADVTSFRLTSSAFDTITLWTWERGLRHELIRLRSAVRAAETMAGQIGPGRRPRQHVVRDGETLQNIAARYLGDWREWTRIADVNELLPGQPAEGTVLIIPDRKG